jgi:hypothetical protein
MRLLLSCATSLVGFVLLVSATAKFREGYRRFSQTVDQYQLLPGNLVSLVSVLLPWFELILGAMLIGSLLLPVSAIAAAILLAVFTAALFVNLMRGRPISCGCFGRESDAITWWTAARAAALCGACILAAQPDLATLSLSDRFAAAALAAGISASFLLTSTLLRLHQLHARLGIETSRRSNGSHAREDSV